MTVYDLPAVNAALNGTCALLLLAGYSQAKARNVAAHRAIMTAALAVSALFLACYLYYHAHAGATRFAGEGWSRPVYFTILTTHTILATVVLPLVVVAVWRAVRGEVERHRRIVRWAWPIWMYVSVTGVLVYFFLYQWFPSR